MPTATDSRKRKTTTDMETSPPKRVTRARAKIAEAKETTMRIATTSARAGAKKTATTATRAASKSTKKVTCSESAKDAKEDMPKNAETNALKPKGRPRKAEQISNPVKPAPEAPKTRARTTKASTEPNVESAARYLRGRGRKTSAEDESKHGAAPKAHPKKAMTATARTTSRSATHATVSTTAKVTAPGVKAPNTRKRVAFKDDGDDDKENKPVVPDTKGKPILKSSGLRSKPVRTTATTRGSTRSDTAKDIDIQEASSHAPMPLSPKKISQVSKSSSNSSEDELCDRSPVRPLSRSPIKAPANPVKSPQKKAMDVDVEPSKLEAFPIKPNTTAINSPARKPPPSPWKGSIQASPIRRVHIENMNFPQSARRPEITMDKDMLKASPKRVNLDFSARRPPATAPHQSLKASFLRSPARRPVSPTRLIGILEGLPDKLAETVSGTDPEISLKGDNNFELPPVSPQRLFIGSSKEVDYTVGQGRETGGTELQDDPTVVAETPPKNAKHEVALFSPPEESADLGSPDAFALPALEERTPQAPGTMVSFTPDFRIRADFSDSESDDEHEIRSKKSYTSSLEKYNISTRDFGAITTPGVGKTSKPPGTPKQRVSRSSMAVVPLAMQLSTWMASSPDKNDDGSKRVFSPFAPATAAVNQGPSSSPGSLPKHSQFEDEMVMHDLDAAMEIHENQPPLDEPEQLGVDAPHTSSEPEEFGDENASPQSAAPLQVLSAAPTAGTTPVFITPARLERPYPREIHTVLKVPLKGSDEALPLSNVARKRSRSVSAPLSEVTDMVRPQEVGSTTLISYYSQRASEDYALAEPHVPIYPYTEPQTPANAKSASPRTPFTSVRKGADARILRGAVVYVDVHTTEGADASGIFVELLASMGARCVKQWTWNPRNSIVGIDGGLLEYNTVSSKVGITHVVYKDGGSRTLQKVRETKGLVHCVGVGWVLDCERENRWLDEADYAYDIATIPRGGHNRRKSMEPRSLANLNGTLVPAETPGATKTVQIENSPTKEFLNLSSRRQSTAWVRSPNSPNDELAYNVPQTPTPVQFNDEIYEDEDDLSAPSMGSPTTPYFLSKGAKLVQQTCPPKQTMQGLFPVTGRIEDQPDESVRQRLILARRKSLQWAPKVGSPLGKAVRYGDV